jgi:hypothetical protein
LFGATFLPLKRGIFQDLLEAHPGELERPVLKAALAFHARSTRYLTAVSSGQMRHDLQGQAVEPVAPEHVYQALLEVFQRRQTRSAEDLRPKLVARIVHAFEVSGLSVQDYVEKMHGSDEGANALLQDAMAEVQSRAARDEALLRAFESSGTQSVEQFAEMYGMQVGAAHATLQRARSARPNP